MKYEILEHKADFKIRVFGKTKRELLENAMLGMLKGANYEKEKKNQNIKVKIRVKSIDFPSLLVDFLSEVLYLTETKKLVFEKMRLKKITEREIEGELLGAPLKRMETHIKGVTYHDLEVEQKKDGTWQATILFDI